MTELLPIERREILEERANTDARFCCALGAAIVIVAILTLGAIACVGLCTGSISVTIPLTPKAAPRSNSFTPPVEQPEQKRILRTVEGAPRSPFGVIIFPARSRAFGLGVAVRHHAGNAARLGVGAPRKLSFPRA